MDRANFIVQCLSNVDQVNINEGIAKHKKMATSPFIFFRGSAPLFYADIKAGNLVIPDALNCIPNTTIIGDCHTSNFGFLTEEGSHGDKVIFSPNDFDDACIAPAAWDLARFITSLFLAIEHCKLVKANQIESKKDYSNKQLATKPHAQEAASAFLNDYIATCQACIDDESYRYKALSTFQTEHILHKPLMKASQRSAFGKDFLTKSALAKAIKITGNRITFIDNAEKFVALSKDEYEGINATFRPYVDDHIHDIVLRINAGTGSVNMSRYYLLVGPKQNPSNQLNLCHVVEVKQQRKAAPLYYFEELSPVNQLNAAHLTANCQRRMQRSPDLVLDEVEWKASHWLIRSRHHAKLGINPEQIGLGKKAVALGGLIDYAKTCGVALALAHCRGDRRSTLFEQTTVDCLPEQKNILIEHCKSYAQQVIEDTNFLNNLLVNN
ncbi:DUF2252 family protein [Thalassotalea sp. M1531]|uniref:DUF2252 family protein n=1 Tax=Thalassotalea algicola TaxID=2716224 RepID=A0A7Y0LBP6_9GAMM|nr:DUF2252 family protein [Thalassotalea algicola]NMP31182.1 DUF2252 family protein [Thalassotalea algicola]